ncbi:MAG: HAMP domain-containing histidine kinase [Firmicutes bacterium]|nr:HAMP domain-containing histidine kinase [Bacillota bacterium]
MRLFINRDAKNFVIILASILFLGIIFTQIITYINAVQFKNGMIMHDYELAGYLSDEYPELVLKIQSVFTSDKSENHLETGKDLLEKSGYKNSVKLHLIPRVNKFYKTNAAANFIFSVMISLTILFTAYMFLKVHYRKIDQYNDSINKIMNGEISTRLADSDEGSLSKFASSINMLITSLHTHIEKEKQNRIFLRDMLTNISHQLKTPLSALSMYIEIMKDEKIDNEVITDFLNKSENELDRMQILIANLLKMAKLDAGIIELNKNEYILNEIVKQATESFQARLVKEQKTLEVKATGNVSYTCDREWMLEALSNLIKNAVEHTSAGNRIEVLIEETPLMAKITVKDNGEGIHPDDINHIFKRFYRSRFSQNKQGTGIGLTLTKTIVEMHEGSISVESTIQKGTAFVIYLPRLTKL